MKTKLPELSLYLIWSFTPNSKHLFIDQILIKMIFYRLSCRKCYPNIKMIIMKVRLIFLYKTLVLIDI